MYKAKRGSTLIIIVIVVLVIILLFFLLNARSRSSSSVNSAGALSPEASSTVSQGLELSSWLAKEYAPQ